MDNIIIDVVEVMDAANTSNVSNDLEDATKREEDKDFLAIFEYLEEVPESGNSKEDDCDNAER